jgi:pimeloyl-ACP methyl ester carboxylesterase
MTPNLHAAPGAATHAATQAVSYTAQEHELPTADGGSIHCGSIGRGPTVLLAHGYLLDHSLWDPVLSRLAAAGYRVVAFDQRGHAASREGSEGSSAAAAAADYRTLFEHFGVDGATLVGHSMGGFLSILFCLQYPELSRRLRRLVLLGGNAGAVAQGSLQNRLQIPLLKLGFMPRLWKMPRLGRQLVAQLFGRDPDERWLESTRSMLLQQSIPRSLPLLRAMCYENYYARLGEIATDTRVVCGELDSTCPAWHSQRLGQTLPQASNTWLPGVGHMLPYEAPDAVCQAILEG